MRPCQRGHAFATCLLCFINGHDQLEPFVRRTTVQRRETPRKTGGKLRSYTQLKLRISCAGCRRLSLCTDSPVRSQPGTRVDLRTGGVNAHDPRRITQRFQFWWEIEPPDDRTVQLIQLSEPLGVHATYLVRDDFGVDLTVSWLRGLSATRCRSSATELRRRTYYDAKVSNPGPAD